LLFTSLFGKLKYLKRQKSYSTINYSTFFLATRYLPPNPRSTIDNFYRKFSTIARIGSFLGIA
jgi:hypothetical protein